MISTPVQFGDTCGYVANDAYRTRLAEPPRFPIPPPPLEYHDGEPCFPIQRPLSRDYDFSRFGNISLLDSIIDRTFIFSHRMGQWAYENRRQIQPILPFIYLGPSSAIKDWDYLRREGITLLLAVRNQASALARLVNGNKAAEGLGIRSAAIDVTNNLELAHKLPSAVRIINDHLEMNHHDWVRAGAQGTPTISNGGFGKVLVFCESGNERSAAVVTSYIMVMFDLNVVEAYQAVQSQRFCVSVDDELKHMLKTFESQLKAIRDVAHTSGGTVSKRSHDMVEDNDDEDMSESNDDMGGTGDGGRSNWAPFVDRG